MRPVTRVWWKWALLPIRLAILLPFWLLSWIGARAEAVGSWLSRRIPGLDP